MKRNSSLDSLRGFAVLLMIVDHFAAVWLRMKVIEFGNIRFFTRPSMLLFSFLLGFFLLSGSAGRNRAVRLGLAALVSNFIYLGAYKRLDILVSMLLVVGIYQIARSHFIWGVLAVLLVSWDPTQGILDYPLSITLACAAHGAVLREGNPKKLLASSLLLTSGAWFLPGSLNYTAAWVIPTTLLMQLFIQRPQIQIPILNFMGQHALLIYSLQWYVLSFTRYWWVLKGK
ncbi:hypothetical protein EBR78_09160 [bacterium]|nr:hypothetical protein [bacterium]NBX83615.1 hypothetical protein [bacterium]